MVLTPRMAIVATAFTVAAYACGGGAALDGSVAVASTTTATTDANADDRSEPGCTGEREAAIFDYSVEVYEGGGFDDPAAAVDDWIANDGDYRLRQDWHDLDLDQIVKVGESAAATFLDDFGSWKLTVRTNLTPGGWLVGGWEACAPQ
ncbi:MAG: hypothetical protein IIB04_02685 [Acidobacteria bacterium]|nr:hypothetical protein [Acidobacteriota bacterium]MCH8985505.1 hypothetical protein [Acidobacteriota bacterium]